MLGRYAEDSDTGDRENTKELMQIGHEKVRSLFLMEKDVGKILQQRRNMGANTGALAQMSKQGTVA